MKPNVNNPICPKCQKRMQKSGLMGTSEGRKQRYRCIYCGTSKTGDIEK